MVETFMVGLFIVLTIPFLFGLFVFLDEAFNSLTLALSNIFRN